MKKIAETLERPVITESFVSSFRTGKWGVKNRPTMKTDRAQYFVQESPVYVMSMLDQIQVSMSRTDKQTNARMVQDTQFGFVDAVYCTEGRNTGLIKSISCSVQVTPWSWGNDFKIIDYLLDSGLCTYVGDGAMAFDNYTFVNAVYVGWCDGERVVDELRKLKLSGEIPRMTSISRIGRQVSVHTTPFRLVRPLFVVSRSTLNLVYEDLGLHTNDPDVLIEAGAIEFLDSMEQECARIAPNHEEVRKMKASETHKSRLRLKRRLKHRRRRMMAAEARNVAADTASTAHSTPITRHREQTEGDDEEEDPVDEELPWFFYVPEEGTKEYMPRRYTHCELDEFAFLSNTASLIPFINHNQAPRNYYQISMAKQALGANMHRGANKELIMASDPLVKCQMQDLMGMKNRGTGQTMHLAMMCRPSNAEDGVLVKREFLELGGLMMQTKMTYKCYIKDVNDPSEVMCCPNRSYTTIDATGLPRLNEYMYQGQCVLGKMASGRDNSIKMHCWEEGVVHSVDVTTVNLIKTATVELRIVRNQIEGDKISARNSQKCTIAEIQREYDLPR